MGDTYGKLLRITGRVVANRRLPDQGALASDSARNIATAINGYVERHQDIPSDLGDKLLEVQSLLRGLCFAGDGDPENAGFAWAMAAWIAVTAEDSHS